MLAGRLDSQQRKVGRLTRRLTATSSADGVTAYSASAPTSAPTSASTSAITYTPIKSVYSQQPTSYQHTECSSPGLRSSRSSSSDCTRRASSRSRVAYPRAAPGGASNTSFNPVTPYATAWAAPSAASDAQHTRAADAPRSDPADRCPDPTNGQRAADDVDAPVVDASSACSVCQLSSAQCPLPATPSTWCTWNKHRYARTL